MAHVVTRHGHCAGRRGQTTLSPTYNTWRSVIDRCTQPTHASWKRYGGAGVTFCERWRSFPNFLADMGERPEGTTLDRIDNSRGYEPGNCRWATAKEQNRNRRNNRFITAFGRTMTLAEWAELRGVRQTVIGNRLRRGWSEERAVSA